MKNKMKEEEYIFEGKKLTKQEYEREIRLCVERAINELIFIEVIKTLNTIFPSNMQDKQDYAKGEHKKLA